MRLSWLMLGLSLWVGFGLFNPNPFNAWAALTPQQQAVINQKMAQKHALQVKTPIAPVWSSQQINTLRQLDPVTQASLDNLFTSLHAQNQSLGQELTDENEASLAALTMLWQAAVERSHAITYAIEKLSRKTVNGTPVKDPGAASRISKHLVQSVARLGGAAGTIVTGSPVGLMSGSLISEALAEPLDPSKVPLNDADMVLLTQAVDDLQRQVIERYFAYRYSQAQWDLKRQAQATLEQHHKAFEVQQKQAPQNAAQTAVLAPLMENLLASAQEEQRQAKKTFDEAKSALILLAGADAVQALVPTPTSLPIVKK